MLHRLVKRSRDLNNFELAGATNTSDEEAMDLYYVKHGAQFFDLPSEGANVPNFIDETQS